MSSVLESLFFAVGEDGLSKEELENILEKMRVELNARKREKEKRNIYLLFQKLKTVGFVNTMKIKRS